MPLAAASIARDARSNFEGMAYVNVFSRDPLNNRRTFVTGSTQQSWGKASGKAITCEVMARPMSRSR